MPQARSAPTARQFTCAFLDGLRILWPVLSALYLLQATMGGIVGLAEGWGLWKGLYFAFITGLTIGYGDLVPSRVASQILAVLIGFLGVVAMGLIAALAVRAVTQQQQPRGGAE
jgi:hypothetical protein